MIRKGPKGPDTSGKPCDGALEPFSSSYSFCLHRSLATLSSGGMLNQQEVEVGATYHRYQREPVTNSVSVLLPLLRLPWRRGGEKEGGNATPLCDGFWHHSGSPIKLFASFPLLPRFFKISKDMGGPRANKTSCLGVVGVRTKRFRAKAGV